MTSLNARVSGVRCKKCKQEVSHVINLHLPQAEALMVDQENYLAREHRKTCDGEVERFEDTTAIKMTLGQIASATAARKRR